MSGVRESSSAAATHKRPGSVLESQSHVEPASSDGSDASAGTISHALPADLTAVREARTVVQEVLDTWSAQDIYDDVVLVASELVANALRHGLQVEQPQLRLPAKVPPERPQAAPDGVRISLVSTGSHVICAVTDPSDAPPVRRLADPLAGSGRGLQLVESLSLCWGWTVLDGDADGSGAGAVQGKSVWAIFPLDLPDRRAHHQVVGAA